jgi:hypothetical protein
VTHIRPYETTGRPVFITVVVHRRIPYLKNLVGQVAPQALPDAYETTKFLFRSDWTLAASGSARMKLHPSHGARIRATTDDRIHYSMFVFAFSKFLY